MFHTKFQASEVSGSEEEDFLTFILCVLWFKHRTSWARTILNPKIFILTNLVKDIEAMLKNKFQASELSGSENEDVLIFLL